MKKKLIRIISKILPSKLHEIIARNEEKKRIISIKKNTEIDSWLSQNKNIHTGERCFILATGPSLNKLDLSKIKDEYTIGVNGIYKIAHKIDLKYFIYVSNWYWKNHVEGLKSFKCSRKFIPANLKKDLKSDNPTSWINVLLPKYYNKFGYQLTVPSFFSKQPHEYFTAGGSVIFLALQLAYHLGFNEIIIIGLDHTYRKDDHKRLKHGGYSYSTKEGDNAHYDKDYNPKDIYVPVDLQAMENAYCLAKNIFEEDNRSIINASPGTMLDTFEKIDYNDLF